MVLSQSCAAAGGALQNQIGEKAAAMDAQNQIIEMNFNQSDFGVSWEALPAL